MRDIALYREWWSSFPTDVSKMVAIEEWLRSGILRISGGSTVETLNTAHPPFYPFHAYAIDVDEVILLMADLRDLSIAQSDSEAAIIRSAVVRVICTWKFEDSSVVSAIRLSFRVGSIFNCWEVCDELAKRVHPLLSGAIEVITGLSDMAVDFGKAGQDLIGLLIGHSIESEQTANLPYLLTRLIESSARADLQLQREIVLGFVARYGESLSSCDDAIDAIEALTDVFIAHLRLIEAPVDSRHAKQLRNVAAYLDEEHLKYVDELEDVFFNADSIMEEIIGYRNEASNNECFLLTAA